MANTRPAGETAEDFVRRTIDPGVRRIVEHTVKHRYLYPLDRATRRQLISLAKQYPRLNSALADSRVSPTDSIP